MPAAQPPFHFAIRRVTARLFEVEYGGYMPDGNEHVLKTEALVGASPDPVGLCYLVADFVGFHRSQVQEHGNLLTRLGRKVRGVGLVKARPVVRFGAVTVSLISNTPIKTFDAKADAVAWLDSLA